MDKRKRRREWTGSLIILIIVGMAIAFLLLVGMTVWSAWFEIMSGV